jgi:hypothetical protein
MLLGIQQRLQRQAQHQGKQQQGRVPYAAGDQSPQPAPNLEEQPPPRTSAAAMSGRQGPDYEEQPAPRDPASMTSKHANGTHDIEAAPNRHGETPGAPGHQEAADAVDQGLGQEITHELLVEAAHWLRYAVAIYGWPMYALMCATTDTADVG